MTSENDRNGAPAPGESTDREPRTPAADRSAAGSGEAVAADAAAAGENPSVEGVTPEPPPSPQQNPQQSQPPSGTRADAPAAAPVAPAASGAAPPPAPPAAPPAPPAEHGQASTEHGHPPVPSGAAPGGPDTGAVPPPAPAPPAPAPPAPTPPAPPVAPVASGGTAPPPAGTGTGTGTEPVLAGTAAAPATAPGTETTTAAPTAAGTAATPTVGGQGASAGGHEAAASAGGNEALAAHGAHGVYGAPGAAGGGEGPLGPWSAVPSAPPPRRRRGGLVAVIVAVTLAAGGLGGYGGFLLADNDSSPGTSTARGGSGDAPERSPESVAGIADEALPSVVTLQSAEGREGGTGTGFVYDEEGHVLTNNHVVAEAAQGGTVTATFSDGESFDAEVVGGAQGYDIAVLRLEDVGDRELTPLPLGDSDEVAVGDATVAIGAPFGLSGTVTTGIISAQDRPVASSDGMGGAASYMSALQTDASINPGNSGGPLLDASGAVIGVNSAIQSNSAAPGQQAGSVGLGFAIPVNQADRVAQDLIENGEPVYAVIGVTVDMSENTTGGAQVVDEGEGGTPAVPPGGPAAEAGLEPGDVITRFGDRVIDSGPTLISEIWTYEPGETIELVYERDGTEHTASLTLDSRVGDQD